MLDVELDLIPELRVVTITSLKFEIDKEAKVVIESEELILLFFVVLKNLLEVRGASVLGDIFRSAVKAMTIKWSKWLDINTLLLTDDGLIVVMSTAMIAAQFILLDSYHNVIG